MTTQHIIIRRSLTGLFALVFAFLFFGCGWGSNDSTHAVVSEAMSAPRNDPPVLNNLSYTLVAIDGRSVKRERAPFLTDAYLGALVDPGKHAFKVSVSPLTHAPGFVPLEVSFEASVEARKRYLIATKDGAPILVEERKAR